MGQDDQFVPNTLNLTKKTCRYRTAHEAGTSGDGAPTPGKR